MKIKICGIKNLSDAAAVNAGKPDYAGFVFAESARRVTAETARELIAAMDAKIKPVGVFVNECAKNAAEIVLFLKLYAAQLHGDETPDYARELAEKTGVKIIKAFRFRGLDTISRAAAFPCDYLLFDAYSPEKRGGTGKSVDFAQFGEFRGQITKPFFIAGGINMTNIAQAAALSPYAADISSGAESVGGKDAEKIGALCAAARSGRLAFGR